MEKNKTNNIENNNPQEETLDGPAVVEKINLNEVSAEKEKENQKLALAERERIDKIFNDFFEAIVSLPPNAVEILRAEFAEKNAKLAEKRAKLAEKNNTNK